MTNGKSKMENPGLGMFIFHFPFATDHLSFL